MITGSPGRRLPARTGPVLRRLRGDRRVLGGSAVLALLAAGACAGPLLGGWPPGRCDLTAFGAPPSARHWFGTDPAGLDVYTATMRGLRGALVAGPAAAVTGGALALVVGGLGGYLLGPVDRIAGWLCDLLLAVPSLLVAAVLWPVLGRAWWSSALLIGGLSWMITARIVRALTVELRGRGYVLAAVQMGVRTSRIIVTHVWPQLAPVLIADVTVNVGTAVLARATLSYLGLGAAPGGSMGGSMGESLGALLAEASSQAFACPWLFAAPAGCLLLIVLAADLLGDGLRSALGPLPGCGG